MGLGHIPKENHLVGTRIVYNLYKLQTKLRFYPMKKTQQGFTLIELMIVVAIIGILAAVALPAYQDYTARAQASEGAVMLSGLKAPVAEWYYDKGEMPDPSTDLNATVSGKYITSLTLTGTSTYTATFMGAGSVNAKLIDKTMTLTFNTTDNNFTWGCDLAATVAPKVCPDP